MLERSYWEGITDPSPQPNGDVRRRLSDLRVQSYLIAAMNAASHVDDPRLNELIADLQDDTDLKVSQAARELVGKESEPAA
jgi:hypothetical protein